MKIYLTFITKTYILVGMLVKGKSADTRRFIMETAFREIHRKGFRATSLSDILETTGLTKGAFYHHFGTKMDLGYAIVNELLQSIIYEEWMKPLETCDDPLSTLQHLLMSVKMEEEVINLGCPLNNLAVEMASVDETFRALVKKIYDRWIDCISASLIRGQKAGIVRSDIDPHTIGAFIVASMSGCRSLAKNAQSLSLLTECNTVLNTYLDSLRN